MSAGADPAQQHLASTVMLVDLAESVLWMSRDEAGTVAQWRGFVAEAERALAALGGRLVRSVGDGLLLEFASPAVAARAALGLHALLAAQQASRPEAQRLQLRIGIHVADVLADAHDIYGHGVNLAARLAGLAQPGQTAVSAAVRDTLIGGEDADLEDLGDCYLKHLPEPLRVYRLHPVGHLPSPMAPAAGDAPLVPTLAVLPLQVQGADAAGGAQLGEVLADDLIAACSVSPHWLVLSRLSTRQLAQPGTAGARCRCDFVLSGSVLQAGDKLRVMLELSHAGDGRVLWAQRYLSSVQALFSGEAGFLQDAVAQTSGHVVSHTLARARSMALPTLEGYAILLQGVTGMHRSASPRAAQAYDSLSHLSERHPRAPEPRAWLGKWHVIRLAQGWAEDPVREAALAHDQVRRALDGQPEHALALAIQGLVALFTERDLARAEACNQRALQANPNEALAWLFQSSVHAHRGEGREALACVARARRLSPLDPLRYYYDGYTSWAALAAGELEQAQAFAESSLRDNREHVPNYLILTLAQALRGRLDEARITAAGLLQRLPRFSVARYVDRYPGGPIEQTHRFGDALRAAGLPD